VIFHAVLTEPTEPPVQWVLRLSWAVKQSEHCTTTHLLQVVSCECVGARLPLSPSACIGMSWGDLYLYMMFEMVLCVCRWSFFDMPQTYVVTAAPQKCSFGGRMIISGQFVNDWMWNGDIHWEQGCTYWSQFCCWQYTVLCILLCLGWMNSEQLLYLNI